MEHEVRESGLLKKVKLPSPTNSEQSPSTEKRNSQDTGLLSPKLPHVIELTPQKALRVGRLREIRSEPKPLPPRIRSNSSGDGPRIPKVAIESHELLFEESFGLRMRGRKVSLSPLSQQSRETANSHHSAATRNRPRSRYVIPLEHPFRIVWDVLTVIFAIAHMHKTHVGIWERQFGFGASRFKLFCDLWFFIDILLNFVSERRTAEGEILRDYRSICARYLTSWFAIDALSLFPWETLYVQPIIDIQNRRGFFRKTFFRTRATIRVVTNRLRVRHFHWFGNVARHTKHHGVGSARLLRLLIKYIPKYVLFFRNMKGVVAVRVLRQVHWLRRFYKTIEKSDATVSLSKDGFDDLSSKQSAEVVRQQPARVDYEDWELVEDDGVPF